MVNILSGGCCEVALTGRVLRPFPWSDRMEATVAAHDVLSSFVPTKLAIKPSSLVQAAFLTAG
jgi:hypothetical protein